MMDQRVLGIIRGFALTLLLAATAWMSAPARTASATATILYVKSGATGANNGTSWANAYTSLQTALDAAALGGYEIWVAAGTYRPFRGFPPSPSDTFQLHNSVAIYGGFAGTEILRSQRNWQTNVTILNGHWNFASVHYFVYHVVTGSGTNATAVLDGFTVTGGNAYQAAGPDSIGGGMYNSHGSPMLVNLTISGNSATLEGGGVYNYESSPELTNVAFSGNSAGAGGGMFNYSGSPKLTNVVFNGNSAAEGGGMDIATGSPTLTNVVFSGNSATVGDGGGINTGSGSPKLTNVVFSGNSAGTFGGGIYSYSNSPTLINITLSGNSATVCGGGIYLNSGNPTIVNSILWGNAAPAGAQIYNFGSSATINYNDIQGGYPGMGNINSDPKFIRNPNPGMGDYGDLHLATGSPAIDAGNSTAVPSGVTTDRDGNPRIMGLKVDMGAYEAFPYRIFLPLIRK